MGPEHETYPGTEVPFRSIESLRCYPYRCDKGAGARRKRREPSNETKSLPRDRVTSHLCLRPIALVRFLEVASLQHRLRALLLRELRIDVVP